jgi:hypothetical protein
MNRATIRKRIADGLIADLKVDGTVAEVYAYRKGGLSGQSPVLLVLSGNIDRTIAGVGQQTYENAISIEIHALVYDGDESNPLTEEQRDDRMDLIETRIASWVAAHQIDISYYRALSYATPTERADVTFAGGGPYQLEIVTLRAEAPDR